MAAGGPHAFGSGTTIEAEVISPGSVERAKCRIFSQSESHSMAYTPPPSPLKLSPYDAMSEMGAA